LPLLTDARNLVSTRLTPFDVGDGLLDVVDDSMMNSQALRKSFSIPGKEMFT
jgi:hypothetical protein